MCVTEGESDPNVVGARGAQAMKNGKWTGIDKRARALFPVDRAYTKLEALFFLQLYIDEKALKKKPFKPWPITMFAKEWSWSRNRIYRFLGSLENSHGEIRLVHPRANAEHQISYNHEGLQGGAEQHIGKTEQSTEHVLKTKDLETVTGTDRSTELESHISKNTLSYKLSEYFQKLLRRLSPKTTIDLERASQLLGQLMEKQPQYEPDEIKQMMDFATSDEFWQDRIISMDAFVRNFGKLVTLALREQSRGLRVFNGQKDE